MHLSSINAFLRNRLTIAQLCRQRRRQSGGRRLWINVYIYVRLTEGRRGREGYYVHLETERSRMAIMLTLQYPVQVHSTAVILPST